MNEGPKRSWSVTGRALPTVPVSAGAGATAGAAAAGRSRLAETTTSQQVEKEGKSIGTKLRGMFGGSKVHDSSSQKKPSVAVVKGAEGQHELPSAVRRGPATEGTMQAHLKRRLNVGFEDMPPPPPAAPGVPPRPTPIPQRPGGGPSNSRMNPGAPNQRSGEGPDLPPAPELSVAVPAAVEGPIRPSRSNVTLASSPMDDAAAAAAAAAAAEGMPGSAEHLVINVSSRAGDAAAEATASQHASGGDDVSHVSIPVEDRRSGRVSDVLQIEPSATNLGGDPPAVIPEGFEDSLRLPEDPQPPRRISSILGGRNSAQGAGGGGRRRASIEDLASWEALAEVRTPTGR